MRIEPTRTTRPASAVPRRTPRRTQAEPAGHAPNCAPDDDEAMLEIVKTPVPLSVTLPAPAPLSDPSPSAAPEMVVVPRFDVPTSE